MPREASTEPCPAFAQVREIHPERSIGNRTHSHPNRLQGNLESESRWFLLLYMCDMSSPEARQVLGH
jgi:hypothetical protein